MGLFSLVSPYLGSALAVAGLGKLDPTLQKFFGYGAAAGYGTDQILDFLRSRMEGEGHAALKNKLEEGSQEGTLRPDERASKERMRQNQIGPDIAQGAIAAGAGLGAGIAGAGLGPMKQLLQGRGSQTQPQIAQQPQNPVAASSPSQQQQPQNSPPSASAPSTPQQPQAQQISSSNAIAKYSPDLDKWLSFNIFSGNPTDAVVKKAQSIAKYKPIISKLEKDLNVSFSDIVMGIYGNPNLGGSASQGMAQGQSQGQGQTSPGQQALLQSLQKLQQLRGKK